MTLHPRTHAVIRPQGPALGFHEGQILTDLASRLAKSGLAALCIDLGRVRWMKGPGFKALMTIQTDWVRAGRTVRLLGLSGLLKRLGAPPGAIAA